MYTENKVLRLFNYFNSNFCTLFCLSHNARSCCLFGLAEIENLHLPMLGGKGVYNI